MDFIKATVNDISLVNKLNEIGEQNWRHEFFSSLKMESYLFYKIADGIAVGVEGYVGYPMLYNGATVLTHRSERTLVSPSQRGKGVFEKLVLHCDEEAKRDHSLCCWGATAALKPFVRAGFDQHTGFKSYIYFPVKHNISHTFALLAKNISLLNPLSAYKYYKKNNLTEIKKRLSFYQLFRPTSKMRKQIKLAPIDLDQCNGLIRSALSSADTIALQLSNDLFNWLAEKGKVYTCYNVLSADNHVGHVVYYENAETNSVIIVDMFVTEATLAGDVIKQVSLNYQNSSFTSVFVALNSKNTVHRRWIDELAKQKAFVRTKAGSFVIKNFTEKKFTIENLLLTDLWLEL